MGSGALLINPAKECEIVDISPDVVVAVRCVCERRNIVIVRTVRAGVCMACHRQHYISDIKCSKVPPPHGAPPHSVNFRFEVTTATLKIPTDATRPWRPPVKQ